MMHGTQAVVIRTEILDKLHAHRERTGIPASKLLAGADDLPDGLNTALINSWLAGKTKTANPDHLYYTLKRWKALPDAPHEIVSVDQSILVAHRERTGVAGTDLLKSAQDMPEGLSLTTINSWLHGGVKTARRDHLEFVLGRWESLESLGYEYLSITSNILIELQSFRDQLLLPGAIFNDTQDVPDGLSVYTVTSWLNAQVTKARKDHIDFVRARCEQLANDTKHRIPITDDMRMALEQGRERSGIGQTALLKSTANIPDDLTPAMISSWIGKTASTARKDHYEFVIRVWK